MFSSNIHGLRNRIVRIFLRTFQNERLPLVSHYGALVGFCEMGQEVDDRWTRSTQFDRVLSGH